MIARVRDGVFPGKVVGASRNELISSLIKSKFVKVVSL